MSTRLWGGFAVVAILTLLAPATTDAQARQRYPYESQTSRVAHDNGYREGLSNGERDGRAGRAYDYQRDSVYQRGDSGYGSGWGDREGYRAVFRQGYADGYRDGYARYARSGGSWGAGAYGGYDSRGGYSRTAAFDRGYRDGYDEGHDAARGNDRFDPRGEKDYRKGDGGYDRRYGSKDYYKQTYREGFISGYDRGFTEFRNSRGGRGWPW